MQNVLILCKKCCLEEIINNEGMELLHKVNIKDITKAISDMLNKPEIEVVRDKDDALIHLNVKVITSDDKNNILGGYIAFVKKAEKLRYTPGYTLTEALKKAVQWDREENI